MAHPTQRSWTGKALVTVSLDGYLARLDGDQEWLTRAPVTEGHARATKSPVVPNRQSHLAGVDHVVMGRGTYELVRKRRPWAYPDHRVLVLSHTLHTSDDRIRVVRSTIEAVRILSERSSQGVSIDGASVLQDWLQRGLVDDLVVTRAPVLIGEGLDLFGRLREDVRLVHLGTEWDERGNVTTRYRVLNPTVHERHGRRGRPH